MKKAAMLLCQETVYDFGSHVYGRFFPTLLISPNALWRNTEKLPDNTWKVCKDGLFV